MSAHELSAEALEQIQQTIALLDREEKRVIRMMHAYGMKTAKSVGVGYVDNFLAWGLIEQPAHSPGLYRLTDFGEQVSTELQKQHRKEHYLDG